MRGRKIQILKLFGISALLYTAANWLWSDALLVENGKYLFVLYTLNKPGRSDLFKHDLKITVLVTLDIVFFPCFEKHIIKTIKFWLN